jgi:succinate dehydrogenase / fumarate reductase cytochrome b subunit
MAATSGAGTRATAADYRPRRLLTLWHSTIGKKYVAAVTGLLLAGFVVAHMLGNLKALEGPGHGHAAIDRYAHFLRTVGSPVFPHDLVLWIERAVLLVAVVLHVVAVGQLWVRNRRSKPASQRGRLVRATYAARTMPWTGILILVFVVFHVLQFSTRTIHPTRLLNGAVYANVYDAFQEWWIVLIYVGAVILLGYHLNHGLWSGAQTAGVDNPDRNWFWRRTTTAVTVFVVVGFAIVPILFWVGAMPKPVGAHP